LYDGPFADWANNSLAGVLYVVFWCIFVHLLFPRIRPAYIAVAVLIVTCLLEIMQLWHPPLLEYVRGFVLGQILIGTSFSWLDFPHYVVGALIGGLWVDRLRDGKRGAD